MALALNKTELKKQRDQLAMFQRFLPSLDLKRQQLLADYQRARSALNATKGEIEKSLAAQHGLFSLIGSSEQDLTGLVQVRSVALREENVLGVRLPVLGEIRFTVAEYSMLAKPFWVDFLIEQLQGLAALHVRREVESTRAVRLDEAVRRITQRVNLFEKVLIPKAEKDIQKIKIYLADTERAAVVRSKLAKAKQSREATLRGVV